MSVEKIKVESEKSVYRCDICGEVIQNRYGSQICIFCNRDVCWKCGDVYDSNCLIPGSFDSDYPDIVCHECWKSGKTFIKKILAARTKHEAFETEMFEKWKLACQDRMYRKGLNE